jgi:hypothetical protein
LQSDGFPDSKRRELILSVGTHRAKRYLSPSEVCEYLLEWLNCGATLSSIATQLHLKRPDMLKRFLKLESLAEELRPLVDWGSPDNGLSFSTAALIASERSSDQLELGKAIIANRLNRREMESILQRARRGQVPLKVAVEEIVRLRPRVEERYVYIGRLRSDVSERLQGLSHKERDDLLKRAINEMLGGECLCTARLSLSRWTLVGDKAFGNRLAAVGKSLDPRINDALAQLLSQ